MAAHPHPKSPNPEPETELPDQATRHQDTYRKVMFGQASDPLFPAPDRPSEVSPEELSRQAMADPGKRTRNRRHPVPAFWRWLFLVALVSLVLGIVFLWAIPAVVAR